MALWVGVALSSSYWLVPLVYDGAGMFLVPLLHDDCGMQAAVASSSM